MAFKATTGGWVSCQHDGTGRGRMENMSFTTLLHDQAVSSHMKFAFISLVFSGSQNNSPTKMSLSYSLECVTMWRCLEKRNYDCLTGHCCLWRWMCAESQRMWAPSRSQKARKWIMNAAPPTLWTQPRLLTFKTIESKSLLFHPAKFLVFVPATIVN